MTQGIDQPPVSIRPARPDDADDAFLAELTPRLVAGAPPWHRPEVIAAGAYRHLHAALLAQRDDEAMLIAEDATGQRLGFVYVTTDRDYFTGEPYGHVSDLIVHSAAEGRGIGGLLLAAAEEWATSRGYHAIALNVFAANSRARGVYERMGYEHDAIRLRKGL